MLYIIDAGINVSSDLINKLKLVLLPRHIRKCLILIILMIVGMVIEAFGVMILMPSIQFAIDQERIHEYPYISEFIKHFNVEHGPFLLLVFSILVFVFLIKATFLSTLTWFQVKLAYEIQRDLTRGLYSQYLNQSYSFHKKNNTATLVRNLTTEIPGFTTNIVLYGLQFLSEVIPVVGISFLLLYIEPIGFLCVVALFGAFLMAYVFLMKTRTQRWGVVRQVGEEGKIKEAQQSFNTIKNIIVSGNSDFFEHKFDEHNIKVANVNTLQSFFIQVPKLWLEFLAVLSIIILATVLYLRGQDTAALIGTIGIFSFSAFRLLPSLNRISGAIQAFRFGLPTLDVIAAEMSSATKVNNWSKTAMENTFSFESFELRNVSFTYDQSKKALDNVSFKIRAGDRVAVVGESGSGKSTLVDVILGLYPMHEEAFTIDSVNIEDVRDKWMSTISYVAQEVVLEDDSLRSNVAFGVKEQDIDNDRVVMCLEKVGLGHLQSSLPLGIHSKLGERGGLLSGGQRQRVALARALYFNCRLLILDEATSALDSNTESSILENVFSIDRKITIISITHRDEVLKYCNKLVSVAEGGVNVKEI